MKTVSLWISFAACLVCAQLATAEKIWTLTRTRKSEPWKKLMKVLNAFNNDIDLPIEESEPKLRKKRYDLNPAWRINDFTYSILKYSEDLSHSKQEEIFKKAFGIWKEAAPQLKFTFKRNFHKANIKISFVKGRHKQCSQWFDGSGPIIAHAYFPEDGRIHFDDDETFTDRSRKGTNLLNIAVHEIGHVLGLGHSPKRTAIMHAVYQEYNGKDLTLDSDDIAGIRELYDIKPNNRETPSCMDTDPALCKLYQEFGYCTPNYEDVMIEMCTLTCNLCESQE